eukprot:TRINITY_DN7171_c0_g1_i1.p1 TRINITY_DN7171_c0_g1~~TRINITY_DN7171_c0_g1_i1.p1  ORF type:complete len:113 (-),score=20.47 TRINITY_DN7171_c0_g1_i1:149-487(-)
MPQPQGAPTQQGPPRQAPAQPPPQRAPMDQSQKNVTEEPDWFYIGDEGKERVHTLTDQMREWWKAGYFNLDVRVRQANEGVHRFAQIRTRDCNFTRPKFQQTPNPTKYRTQN